MKKILTRSEEFLLLAVLRLADNAYPVTIFEKIGEATGSTWTIGAIYFPLQRLEEKGYLTSYLGDTAKERGGKSRRYYRVTDSGLEALSVAQDAQNRMWKDIKCVKMK